MNWHALAAKLTAMRKRTGLTQSGLAYASGVNVKTISSFETSFRVPSIKLAQLEAIVAACGMTLADFFEWEYDEEETEQHPIRPPQPHSNEAMDRRAKRLAAKEQAPVRDIPSPQSPLGNRRWSRLLPWSS